MAAYPPGRLDAQLLSLGRCGVAQELFSNPRQRNEGIGGTGAELFKRNSAFYINLSVGAIEQYKMNGRRWEREKEKDDKGYGWRHPLESAADKQSNQLIFKLCKSTEKVVIERERDRGRGQVKRVWGSVVRGLTWIHTPQLVQNYTEKNVHCKLSGN